MHCNASHPPSYTHCPKTGKPLAAGAALIGRTVAGRYRIVGLLGEGGMGAVYVAEHLLIGRRVALKRLHPELANDEKAVTRFQREARAAAATGHEHIVEVLDLGYSEDGAPFLVMEYVRGKSLTDILRREGRLVPERAAQIMGQVLAALSAVHAHGIVHRDLKPDNILLTRKGSDKDYVKILDFGISKMKKDEEDALNLTRTGVMLGTPYYMSPEQARGDRDLDHRVDLYAAGIILFETLSGRLPFEAANYHALLQAILRHEPTRLDRLVPNLPPKLVEIAHRAFSRDAAARYASASEMLAELVPFGASEDSLRNSRGDNANSSIPPARLQNWGPRPSRRATTGGSRRTPKGVTPGQMTPQNLRVSPPFGAPVVPARARRTTLPPIALSPSGPGHETRANPSILPSGSFGSDASNARTRYAAEAPSDPGRALGALWPASHPTQAAAAVRGSMDESPELWAPRPSRMGAPRSFHAQSNDWSSSVALASASPPPLRTLNDAHSQTGGNPLSGLDQSGTTRIASSSMPSAPALSANDTGRSAALRGLLYGDSVPPRPGNDVGTTAEPFGGFGSPSGAFSVAQIKGALIVAALDYVGHALDAGSNDPVLNELPSAVRSRVSGVVLPVAWFPISVFEEVLLAADRLLLSGEGATAYAVGRAAAERELPKTYRVFLQTATPATALERLPSVFRTYHSDGELKVIQLNPGTVRIDFERFHPDSYLHAMAMCGFFCGFLEMTGGENVRGAVLSSKGRGDPKTVISIHWS